MPDLSRNINACDYRLPRVENVPERVLLDMLVQYRQAATEIAGVTGSSARTIRHRLLEAADMIEHELVRREVSGSDSVKN